MVSKEAILYDLEFTTWQGALERNWSRENEHREIIRIGALRVNSDTFQEIDNLDIIIKPLINPILSEYCTKLTGVSDKQITLQGMELEHALQKFIDFVGEEKVFSYGEDILVIIENLKLNKIEFNAKTLINNRSVVANLRVKNSSKKANSTLGSRSIEAFLYGPGFREIEKLISEGVQLYINFSGCWKEINHINLAPWMHFKAPETRGKYSGEIAETLGVNDLAGEVHNPLFDVRSLNRGLRELVISRHIENPLNRYI